MRGFFFVGTGGAFGAVLRYALSMIPYRGEFPLLTLITNILGAFVIGCIAGATSRKVLSGDWVLFLKTGVCGGFTTFSTFSLEAYTLFAKGNGIMASVYMITSGILCVIGVMAGMYVTDRIG